MLTDRARSVRVVLGLTGVAMALTNCSGPISGHGAPTSRPVWSVTPGLAVVALVNSSAPADDLIGSYICGGSLVSPRVVLTAAHCVTGRVASSIDVVVGADNLCRGAPVGGDRGHVRRIRVVEGRDLALLRLSAPSRLTPLAAVDPEQRPAGQLTAIGWGRASELGPTPCTRTAVQLDQVEAADCADLFTARAAAQSPDWLCARPAVGQTRNTCVGDSGGPLLAGTGADLRLVGVTSFGQDCSPRSAGVYASARNLGSLLAHR